MKIGLIADIHANLPALTSVLHALRAENVVAILCAGDLVCYGAQPSSVIQLLRMSCIPSVAGNYDEAVGWNLPTASRKPSSPANEPIKQAALDWAKRHVSANERSFLRNLPRSMRYVFDGKSLAVVHAGLDTTDEWITPDDPAALTALVQRLNADVVMLGHTHQPFIESVAWISAQGEARTTQVINPGAVGRSLDGDPRAAYAIWESESGIATLHRLAYDVESATQAIAATDMPPAIAQMVARGLRRVEQLEMSPHETA
jgi:putative phosphoesterase